MTARDRCPGSRTIENLRDILDLRWCGYCLRWVPVCRDGTMRSHPVSSDSLAEARGGGGGDE